MRSFGPLPLILERSTPSMRAKARTDGDACAPRNASSSTGAAAGLAGGADSAAAGAAGAGAAGGAPAGLAVVAAAARFAARALVDSSVRIALPSLTLSPTLTLRSLTVPAAGAGTSMVALSDSRVTSESSAFTVSPGLTKTSMTGTSLKSPMSGTLTSIVLMKTPRKLYRMGQHARQESQEDPCTALRLLRLCGEAFTASRAACRREARPSNC